MVEKDSVLRSSHQFQLCSWCIRTQGNTSQVDSVETKMREYIKTIWKTCMIEWRNNNLQILKLSLDTIPMIQNIFFSVLKCFESIAGSKTLCGEWYPVIMFTWSLQELLKSIWVFQKGPEGHISNCTPHPRRNVKKIQTYTERFRSRGSSFHRQLAKSDLWITVLRRRMRQCH